MSELGYLDDRAFAESWVRSRMSRAKGRDGRRCTGGSCASGVPRAIAEEVVRAHVSFEDGELERARQLVRGPCRQATAIRRLTGRGFRSRTIAASILRRMKRGSPSRDGGMKLEPSSQDEAGKVDHLLRRCPG